MKDEQKFITDHADTLLRILNQDRHDWLNHLQVLHAYLKLGRYQDGEAYLQKVTEEAHRESMIARINCSRLSAFFLTFNALNRDIIVEVEVKTQVDVTKLEMQSDSFFYLISTCIGLLQHHLHTEQVEHPHLAVTLFHSDNEVFANFDLEGQVSALVAGEVEKLIHDHKGMAKLVSEQIHTDTGWIAEMSFPCKM
ncbi:MULTISPECIES: Spo0B domain-containing protein [Brevibacillus]|uniref:Sporulation protein n=2 Tax=Brevibacillus TaxID=55080 RepID=A0A0F7BYH5_BRELA|nr:MULTISPECIES: Spo0B domain-containing protein [Brevibacillus]AKF92232.1 sporulation protein [Brevibacillus laterosporus]AYB39230.1 sporulation protein [Brevibacillus laterosporus]MBG9775193.1 sporulation protein [Brevibacillus laterosporus]MBG9800323.1 sporulation protein [Brevibacillus laterosporus]MBM7108566.1 Sporulation initiation phosphotransferase B [Brevibacillus laterosporus]